MWTISINSAINDGRTALYDESCSSTLASTFSNGRKRNPEAGVVSPDIIVLLLLSVHSHGPLQLCLLWSSRWFFVEMDFFSSAVHDGAKTVSWGDVGLILRTAMIFLLLELHIAGACLYQKPDLEVQLQSYQRTVWQKVSQNLNEKCQHLRSYSYWQSSHEPDFCCTTSCTKQEDIQSPTEEMWGFISPSVSYWAVQSVILESPTGP